MDTEYGYDATAISTGTRRPEQARDPSWNGEVDRVVEHSARTRASVPWTTGYDANTSNVATERSKITVGGNSATGTVGDGTVAAATTA